MKVTKKRIKVYVQTKLATDGVWATKALVRIFNENQTSDEQNSEVTIHNNSRGFNGTDANFLSSLAKQFISKGYLSEKQMLYVHKKIKKYWKQVVDMSDQTKLRGMVEAAT
jgi:hypothetical protein